ncbi:MAG: pyroglutamyl-peptidase I [Eubacteriales bacterium]|nr:pyroglutamyl-peptidase I [Eubacteriales bacterium]
MKILITGFDPFGGENVNPSYEAIKKISINNPSIEVITKELPTVFKKSIEVLDETIESVKPDVVVCTGQAGGRFDISLERVGINIIDARIPDNDGDQPVDENIFKDGQEAYFSTIPIKAIVKNMRENGIPASVSNTAGTFVCNCIFYGAMYLIDKKYPDIKGGFVHVPFLPEQVTEKVNIPSMSLENITRAFEVMIETIATTDKDIKEIGGTIS